MGTTFRPDILFSGAHSINCLYANKQAVDVDFEPKLLTPGESCEALVVFKPRDAIKYCEEVPFEINGLLRKTVVIRGEGTQTKVSIGTG